MRWIAGFLSIGNGGRVFGRDAAMMLPAPNAIFCTKHADKSGLLEEEKWIEFCHSVPDWEDSGGY